MSAPFKPFSVAVLAVLLAAARPVLASDPGLLVDALAGTADLQRLGQSAPLKPGDALAERDLLHVPAGSRVRLSYSSRERRLLDLGADSELALEKLPKPGDGVDFKTIVTLTHGRMRAFWSRPRTPESRPLHVYFGGLRVSLVDGEIYIESEGPHQRVCAVYGQAVLIPVADAPMTLTAPLCYDSRGGSPATVSAGDPALWKSMRTALGPDPDITAPSASVVALSNDEDEPAAAATASSPAKPAPAPTSAPAAPVTTPAEGVQLPMPASGTWSINLASLDDPAAATREVQRLQAAGYAAVSQPALINGHSWYRVQVPGFASADAARIKADEIKTQLGYRSAWLVHVP